MTESSSNNTPQRSRRGCMSPACGRPAVLTTRGTRLCNRHAKEVELALATTLRPNECFRPGCDSTDLLDGSALCHWHAMLVAQSVADHIQATTPAPEPQQPRKQTTTDGTIYALLNGYNVKVGWTANLERRLREYPPSSQLLVAYPGTRKDETALKRRFAHIVTHGSEWFPYAPQITEWVDRMVAEHGAPDGHTAGPRKSEVARPHADKPTARPRREVRHIA